MTETFLSPAACRAARALLKWSIRDLAEASSVAFTTVHKLEQGAVVRSATIRRLLDALSKAGVSVQCSPAGDGAILLKGDLPSPREAAEAIVHGIVRIARTARKGDRAEGLGGSQLSVLSTIRYNPGITLKLLARMEGVAHPTMSRMVSTMAAAQWVRREKGSDLRFQRLVLTDTGHQAFEKAWERRVTVMSLVAERLHPASATDMLNALRPLAEGLGVPSERLARQPYSAAGALI
jgi:DNA-binding MarR family transcriptional regulator